MFHAARRAKSFYAQTDAELAVRLLRVPHLTAVASGLDQDVLVAVAFSNAFVACLVLLFSLLR